ncbi:sigma-54-dependent Fis family transcriptional regulator [candidate division KSB1 bacterium]|nr:sigma-54-dependent Fis family transcriptional regulator [candidate division KSB1 bacterium]
MEFQNITNMGATKLNSFKILFFGDAKKKALLDGIDWQRKEYELLMTEKATHALEVVSIAKPKVILIDFDQKNFKATNFVNRLSKIANGSTIIGLSEKSYLDVNDQYEALGVRQVLNTTDDMYKLQQELSKIVDKELELLQGENLYQQQKSKFDFHNIIGQCRELHSIFNMITKITKKKWITVLILGETGTGKELIARAIHYQSSNQYRPFVEINCTTLTEHLLESELFGHERGAFTDAKTQKKGLFEIANNGTLFLDEIGEIAPVIQLKLLKAIEDKKVRRVGGTKDIHVNTRIIAATNKNLQEAIKDKVFRNDLYYRLNVATIQIPPLRDRGDDVLILARKFLKDYALDYGSQLKTFSTEAEVLLKRYDWPGNIRELKHTIERIVLLGEGTKITKENLDEAIKSETPLIMSGEKHVESIKIDIPTEGISLDAGEKLLVKAMLEKTGWNKRKTSELLNISRPRLDRKIKKYNLTQNRSKG